MSLFPINLYSNEYKSEIQEKSTSETLKFILVPYLYPYTKRDRIKYHACEFFLSIAPGVGIIFFINNYQSIEEIRNRAKIEDTKGFGLKKNVGFRISCRTKSAYFQALFHPTRDFPYITDTLYILDAMLRKPEII